MDPQIQFTLERLLTDYVHCIDDDRLEEWPGFFADSCVYKITSAENYERGLPIGVFFANSRGMLEDRVTALREANIYEPQRYRHLVSLDGSRGIEFHGRTHHADRRHDALCDRALSRPYRDLWAAAAFRRKDRGMRQQANRHFAGDSALTIGNSTSAMSITE